MPASLPKIPIGRPRNPRLANSHFYYFYPGFSQKLIQSSARNGAAPSIHDDGSLQVTSRRQQRSPLLRYNRIHKIRSVRFPS